MCFEGGVALETLIVCFQS